MQHDVDDGERGEVRVGQVERTEHQRRHGYRQDLAVRPAQHRHDKPAVHDLLGNAHEHEQQRPGEQREGERGVQPFDHHVSRWRAAAGIWQCTAAEPSTRPATPSFLSRVRKSRSPISCQRYRISLHAARGTTSKTASFRYWMARYISGPFIHSTNAAYDAASRLAASAAAPNAAPAQSGERVDEGVIGEQAQRDDPTGPHHAAPVLEHNVHRLPSLHPTCGQDP